jgi:hypothetical protein
MHPELPYTEALPPYQQHSATSKAAAAKIRPHRATGQRAVLMALHEHPGGLTDLELQEVTGLRGSTERPRRVDLCRAGLVYSEGTRTPESGRRASSVWKLTASGADAASAEQQGPSE